jgi:hypothetical protein
MSLFETSDGIDREGDVNSRANVAVPVPIALLAEKVMVKAPAASLGVPEMSPVVVLMERPRGRPVALKDVGELSAEI